MFENAAQHEMELVQTLEDGAEEWVCSRCTRRFILYWPPNFKRVILDEGDENVIHAGGKGGVQMGAAQAWTENGQDTDMVNDRYSLEDEDEEEEIILSPELRAALNELDWGD